VVASQQRAPPLPFASHSPIGLISTLRSLLASGWLIANCECECEIATGVAT
jgi:hypothetical protein